MSVAAVVLAGGSGRRAALGHNKALAELGGRSLLELSVEALRPFVDRVVVVARPADRAAITDLVAADVLVVDGGQHRHASERAGLAAVGDAEVVAIHDAARPLVGEALVRRVLDAAAGGVAAVPVLPRSAPIAHWPPEADGAVLHDALLVDRGALVGVQTPQAAPTAVLRAAFDAAADATGPPPTDTVEPVLRHLDVAVTAVDGDPRNLKVTWPGDVARAGRLLQDPDAVPVPPALHRRSGRPSGGPPAADIEVDGVTPVTDSLRVVERGRVLRAVDRSALVDVVGDLLAAPGVVDDDVTDLSAAVERAVLDGATLRLRRRR